ncbi:hypothetical protein [Paenarthrobacter nitroguajacolicus]|uniref:hypothetical protein n=1 Tax=Paenarthrobacter nitroguajacolicus TaxID=211146 RepID=UPI00248C9920|nr:hypothetical protein [Paenarthrobacter nitroguajacolicus]MDI2035178.1 hypothetical protein [Paenarthrobacter nitroguajacolicus]
MTKSLFMLLFAGGVGIAAVIAAWVAFLALGKGGPTPVVLAVTVLIGIGGGALMGARLWDDRQTLRQRATEEDHLEEEA